MIQWLNNEANKVITCQDKMTIKSILSDRDAVTFEDPFVEQ